MHVWPILDHDFMHIATQQRIHAELERLSNSYLLGEEFVALIRARVLLVLAVAIGLVRLAHACRDVLYRYSLRLCRVGGVGGRQKCFQQICKPPEGDVVLRDFAFRVPGQPGVDLDRERDIAKGWERKVDACGCRGDVLLRKELHDLEAARAPNDGHAV